MLGNLALIENDVLFRIDAAGDEGRGHLTRIARQFRGILPHRNGMQIDHAIYAVVTPLQIDEFDDRAEIIAEMQITGRLHAGKNQFLECHHGSPSCSLRA